MSLGRRTPYLGVLVSGLAACSDATSPASLRATVTVPSQSLVVTTNPAGSVSWIQFTIPVRVDNTGSSALTFVVCASRVETSVSGAWAVAWTPICLADQATPVVVPAGERREFTVSVGAAVQGPGRPEWVPGTIAGTYRFAAGLVPAGASGAVPMVASNTFTLVGAP